MARVYQFKQGSTLRKFMEMSPSPRGVQPMVTYFARTQVNGVSIYQDGTRGDMQRIMTVADAANAEGAESFVKTYESSCGQVWEVIYDNTSYGNFLLDSVTAHASPIVKLIGGANFPGGDPKYIIEAQWNIFPINPAP